MITFKTLFNVKSEEKGLNMKVKKTKTMLVCRDETPDVRIVVNG